MAQKKTGSSFRVSALVSMFEKLLDFYQELIECPFSMAYPEEALNYFNQLNQLKYFIIKYKIDSDSLSQRFVNALKRFDRLVDSYPVYHSVDVKAHNTYIDSLF